MSQAQGTELGSFILMNYFVRARKLDSHEQFYLETQILR